MPTTPPGGASRRRRIAGERRTGRSSSAVETAPPFADPEETTAVGAAPVEPSRSSRSVEAPAEPPLEPAEPTAPTPPTAPGRRFGLRRARPDGDVVAAPEAVDEPDVATRPSRGSRSGWWGSPLSLVALAVLLVALVAVVVLGAFGLLGNDSVGDVRHEQAVSRAGEEASASAERAAAAVLAYDYRHLDADKAAALPFLTSSFQKQYEQTFQRVVRPTALQVHARVTADVQDSGVIRATPDAVKVLVFVDQTTASTAHPGERTSLNRVEMDMRKVGQSWKVDQITVY